MRIEDLAELAPSDMSGEFWLFVSTYWADEPWNCHIKRKTKEGLAIEIKTTGVRPMEALEKALAQLARVTEGLPELNPPRLTYEPT